jgi:hypothetical protein
MGEYPIRAFDLGDKNGGTLPPARMQVRDKRKRFSPRLSLPDWMIL